MTSVFGSTSDSYSATLFACVSGYCYGQVLKRPVPVKRHPITGTNEPPATVQGVEVPVSEVGSPAPQKRFDTEVVEDELGPAAAEKVLGLLIQIGPPGGADEGDIAGQGDPFSLYGAPVFCWPDRSGGWVRDDQSGWGTFGPEQDHRRQSGWGCRPTVENEAEVADSLQPIA